MRSFRFKRLRTVAVAAALAAGLGADGAGASRLAPANKLASAGKLASAVPSNPDDKTILHVLNRIAFGPRPGDLERVRQVGLQAYIDQQLQPEHIADVELASRLGNLQTLGKSSRDIAEQYYIPAQEAQRQAKRQASAADADMKAPGKAPGQPGADAAPDAPRTPEQIQAQRMRQQVLGDLSQQKILRASYSDRQLEEVMTDFWFNHFNVFAGKGPTQIYLTEYERDAIRPHALGKFRDLLEATATSPAMLFYLDNWQSADPNAPDPRLQMRQPMRGGFFGNPGRPGARFPMPPPRIVQPAQTADNNANKTKRGLNENYGRELMELHTLGVDGGYTQQDVIAVARAFTGWTIAAPRQGGGFRFEPRMHDNAEKIVLGHKLNAGGGREDGEHVLDILATHPSTARFIATKLVRRFVADTPPPLLVERAAARFQETKGDIREVLRTILTSPEFFAPETYRAKVKTPFEFVVSAVRATGSQISSALPIAQTLRQMGMPLYGCQPPTGYKDTADAWVNTGALLNRMNFALSLVSGKMHGVEPAAAGIEPADSVDAARSNLLSGLLANDISAATQATLAKAQGPEQAAALTLGSPEFQRR